MLQSCDYDSAKVILETLGDFRDAKELIEQGNAEQRYAQGAELMESGDYEKALTIFFSLGNYEDSASKAQKCKNIIDYNAATQLYRSGNYEAAKTAFTALGSYSDAKSMAAKCQNSIDYDRAVALMGSGDLDGAAKILTALSNFKDSSELAKECKCSSNYEQALRLMERGDYAAAAKLLEYASSVNYKDAKKLLLECTSSGTYDEAVAAFNAGKFYSAYELFNTIIGYKDAEDYADSCVQSKPSSTELYHNSTYSGIQNSLNIKSSYSGSTYIKIYSGSALVSTVFFNGRTTVDIYLPNGTYKIKAALGDTWFGTEEMFGDEGTYSVLTFSGGAETIALSDGDWELTLGGVSNGNVGNKSQSREEF